MKPRSEVLSLMLLNTGRTVGVILFAFYMCDVGGTRVQAGLREDGPGSALGVMQAPGRCPGAKGSHGISDGSER